MGYSIQVLYNKNIICECSNVEDCESDNHSKYDNFMQIGFNISYNHCENLKAVGFYPRDFNGRNMREILIALSNAISKMLSNNISPLEMLRNIESFQKHPELYPPKKIEKAFYEAQMENLLAILMCIREKIERNFANELDLLYWHSD